MNRNNPRNTFSMPREILVSTETTDLKFRKADYPWLSNLRVTLKGGDATQPDGTRGNGGYVLLELYDRPTNVVLQGE